MENSFLKSILRDIDAMLDYGYITSFHIHDDSDPRFAGKVIIDLTVNGEENIENVKAYIDEYRDRQDILFRIIVRCIKPKNKTIYGKQSFSGLVGC